MSNPTPCNHSMSDSCVRPGRIVVVGPCAAGKTTLVNALSAFGYDAHPCAQEHSEIATLWRHSQPEVLIALKVDLGAVRSRRGSHWPAWLYDTQVRRLTNAYSSADLVIDASRQDASAVLDAVVAYLANRAPDRA
jgi:hypothetical protein